MLYCSMIWYGAVCSVQQCTELYGCTVFNRCSAIMFDLVDYLRKIREDQHEYSAVKCGKA